MKHRWVRAHLAYLLTAALAACSLAHAPIDSPVVAPTPSLPFSTPVSYPAPTAQDVSAYPIAAPAQDVPATLTAIAWTPPAYPIASTPVPPSSLPEYILEGVFLDPSHGWLLGLSSRAEGTTFQLAATADGGETWIAVPLPADPYQAEWWNQAHVFFADPRTGWVAYPGIILTTADGGASWTKAAIPGVIRTMTRALDGTLWALEGREADGVVWQIVGPDYSDWRDLGARFPADLRQGAVLVLLDAQEWWFGYTAIAGDGALEPRLLVSLDGGARWEERPAPCEDPRLQLSALVALTHERLWLMCGAVWTSVESLKAVYWTADGGQTWMLRGRALGEPGDTLSSTGLLGSFGAVSADFVYMGLHKTTHIALTRDGGAAWLITPVPCAVDYFQTTFVDPNTGWAYGGGCVARTLDGGLSWTCDGPACISSDRPGPLWPP